MRPFFYKIIRFFKGFKAQAKPSATTKPDLIVKEPGFNFIPVIFAVRGHNSSAQGTSYQFGKRESEWVFHGPVIADFLIFLDRYCPIIPAFGIERPVGSYGHQVRSVKNLIKKITNGMRSYSLNFHFNSGGGLGSENLIAKGTADIFDNLFADKISDVLEVALGIPQRRDGGVFEIPENHNGGGMIKGEREVNCIGTILEPVFDHDHVQARMIFDNPLRYSKIVAETVVVCYLIRGFIKKEDIKTDLHFWDISEVMPIPRRLRIEA